MQAEQKTVSDRDAITATIETYVNGGKSGKGADMKPAFHEGATIYGYIGPDLFGSPIQGLFDWNDGNGPATELVSNITNIDIEGTIATARVELDNWTGHKFTDMFTLLKTDGEWKIISKVFYLYPEN
jgi:putative lumazine-binding protein